MSPLLAQSGHPSIAGECPLLGGKADIDEREIDKLIEATKRATSLLRISAQAAQASALAQSPQNRIGAFVTVTFWMSV
jgi:hypothetical protein